MGAKAELERELIFCKARIEALEEQLRAASAFQQGLTLQVEKLQDSLISVRAPDAYRDQQLEKEEPQAPMSPELQEKHRITKEFTQDYMNALEKPMFRNGDDLEDLIVMDEELDDLAATGIVRFTDTTPKSVHGNNES